jgi:hypothetical protein
MVLCSFPPTSPLNPSPSPQCKERKSNVLARRAASPAAAALKGWESQAYKGSRELKELLGALDLADQM